MKKGRILTAGLVFGLLLLFISACTLIQAVHPPPSELRLVRVDVEAVVDLCARLVGGMVERGRGAVLNVASVGKTLYAVTSAMSSPLKL